MGKVDSVWRRWAWLRRNRPRHVVIVVQNLPVPLDRRVWLECEALREAGYLVSVVCPRGPGDPGFEILEEIRLYKYRPPRAVSNALGFAYEFVYCFVATALLTIRILLSGPIDVFQACNPPDTYFALAAPLRIFGTRFVFDQHDLCPEVYETRFNRSRGALLSGLRVLERLTYATADHVIATNTSYKAVALGRGSLRDDQVTVVRNGPDLNRLTLTAPRPELKNGRDYLCVYLGVMGPQDGVDMVVRAAEIVVKEMGRKDIQFALLGFGDCLEDLKTLTADLALTDYVTFTGRVDDTKIRPYLSTADLGLSPDPITRFNQLSTMNKTMEYMAFSLPVLAFDLIETRVSAGDAAVYVDECDPVQYAKELVNLIDDAGRRAELGAIGARRVREELAWHHQVGGYVQVVGALVGEPT